MFKTDIVVTGTGTPIHLPHIAGPGVLIRRDNVLLQFDVGRATTMRLAACDVALTELSAVFVTHHHSDHVIGLPDLLITRWLDGTPGKRQRPLPVHVPDGPGTRLIERILEPWSEEVRMRAEHQGRVDLPDPKVKPFEAGSRAKRVARFGDVRVDAFTVRHEPVVPAVGYRVTTPEGVIVVSGDTSVCEELEAAAADADVIIHEAFCRKAVPEGTLSDADLLLSYHADSFELGKMAARLDVDTLILTHLIPPITNENVRDMFIDDVRNAGYDGRLLVADDLTQISLG